MLANRYINPTSSPICVSKLLMFNAKEGGIQGIENFTINHQTMSLKSRALDDVQRYEHYMTLIWLKFLSSPSNVGGKVRLWQEQLSNVTRKNKFPYSQVGSNFFLLQKSDCGNFSKWLSCQQPKNEAIQWVAREARRPRDHVNFKYSRALLQLIFIWFRRRCRRRLPSWIFLWPFEGLRPALQLRSLRWPCPWNRDVRITCWPRLLASRIGVSAHSRLLIPRCKTCMNCRSSDGRPWACNYSYCLHRCLANINLLSSVGARCKHPHQGIVQG